MFLYGLPFQQVTGLTLSPQHAPNLSIKLCDNHKARFDAADSEVPFKGF